MDSCKGIVLAWVMEKQTPWDHTNHDKPHLAHSFFVVVVHLADQGIAEVHGDALDGLVLPALVEDVQQQLVHSAVLELQLLRNAEVTQGQAAVPLHLGQKEAKTLGQVATEAQTPPPHVSLLLGTETIFLPDYSY